MQTEAQTKQKGEMAQTPVQGFPALGRTGGCAEQDPMAQDGLCAPVMVSSM